MAKIEVVKRDGRIVPFNLNKIIDAVLAAFKSVDGELSDYAYIKAGNIADYIAEQAESRVSDNLLTIEEIQDMVEKGLMSTKRRDVAKAYILYREDRAKERLRKTNLLSTVSEKLSAQNVKNQNANVDERSFGGRMGEANGALMRQYALDYCLSDMAKQNHLNNEIYIHDLDHYAVGDHNCFDKFTSFITTKGVKTFNDFQEGDIIQVLSPDGTWREAVVHQYGIQPVKAYVFKKNKTEKTILATPNHRWLNQQGDFQEGLSIGDKVFDSPYYWNDFDFDEQTPEAQLYWCYGFVLGDGTLETRFSKTEQKYRHTGKTKVKLCGNKSKYLSHFQKCGYGLNCQTQEPEIVGIKYDKTIPDFDNLPLEDLIAFIHGYYDADGTHALSANTLKPIYSIQSSCKENCDFIEKYFPVAGLYINSIKDKTGQETNFGTRGYTKNYQFFGQKSNKFNWHVKEIQEHEPVEVWCLEVEETHAFVLDGGITTGNCLSIPFDDLLANGFTTRQTDVRPANSVNTAFQLVAVIFQLQSLQQFGGVSATHLDWTMVPYVRKSFHKHYIDGLHYVEDHTDKEVGMALQTVYQKINSEKAIELSMEDKHYYHFEKAYQYAMDMTKRETHQAVEALYHNLNTLQSRSGNQLPFTSINYGTCTLPEGRMVIRALLEVSIEGLGKLHKTSIFPCGIFQCMKGVNRKLEDPNYDLYQLALKSTAQRLYPNYANVDWSGNAGYDPDDPCTYFSTMGCRTANGWDVNGLGQRKDGRGNICPVTIILPTLAMEVRRHRESLNWGYIEENAIKEFMELLDTKIHEAKDMLIERFDWICSQSADSAKFMYENGLMAGYKPEEGIRSALKHGTLAIGQIGLAETLQILIGCDHTESKGMKLAKEIEQLFKDRCAEFKEQYKLNFGVYYTPAENLCYTSMKKFQNKYGEIPKVSDKDFFTNSIHVPVWKQMSPFEKIDIESQLTGYSSAGCITYVELDGGVKNNISALETIVNYAMDHDIPYFAVNVPNDACQECGYTDEIDDTCPMCGSHDITRLRRVTGYLTGDFTSAFNPGKVQETNMRVKHK